MDKYVTGAVIRRLREAKRMTQEELAERIFVSSKAVSKWETGQGFPDISLLEPLAKALDISVIELLSGEDICNTNHSANIARGKFYACPVCGNVIRSIGEAVVSAAASPCRRLRRRQRTRSIGCTSRLWRTSTMSRSIIR